MEKQKKVKADLTDDLEENQIEENQQDGIKETKFDTLLNLYKAAEDEFTVTLYRKTPGSKGREFITTYDSEIPTQTEIRDKYGAGKYRIMLYDVNNKWLDAADVNIAELKTTETNNQTAPDRSQILNELKAMSEIIGNRGGEKDNISQVILKLSEMQQKQFESLTKFQIDSNQKMTDLIMSMQSKKSNLSEIMDVIEFVDGLKNQTAEKNTVETLLESPMIQSLIPVILQKFSSPGTAQPKEIKAPSITPDMIIKKLPDDFKKTITPENHLKVIDILYEQNKTILQKAVIEAAINQILINNKG